MLQESFARYVYKCSDFHYHCFIDELHKTKNVHSIAENSKGGKKNITVARVLRVFSPIKFDYSGLPER